MTWSLLWSSIQIDRWLKATVCRLSFSHNRIEHKNMRKPDVLVSTVYRLYYFTPSSFWNVLVLLAQSSNSNFVFTLNTIDPLEIQANHKSHAQLIFYFLWSLWPEKLIVIELPLQRIIALHQRCKLCLC